MFFGPTQRVKLIFLIRHAEALLLREDGIFLQMFQLLRRQPIILKLCPLVFSKKIG